MLSGLAGVSGLAEELTSEPQQDRSRAERYFAGAQQPVPFFPSDFMNANPCLSPKPSSTLPQDSCVYDSPPLTRRTLGEDENLLNSARYPSYELKPGSIFGGGSMCVVAMNRSIASLSNSTLLNTNLGMGLSNSSCLFSEACCPSPRTKGLLVDILTRRREQGLLLKQRRNATTSISIKPNTFRAPIILKPRHKCTIHPKQAKEVEQLHVPTVHHSPVPISVEGNRKPAQKLMLCDPAIEHIYKLKQFGRKVPLNIFLDKVRQNGNLKSQPQLHTDCGVTSADQTMASPKDFLGERQPSAVSQASPAYPKTTSFGNITSLKIEGTVVRRGEEPCALYRLPGSAYNG